MSALHGRYILVGRLGSRGVRGLMGDGNPLPHTQALSDSQVEPTVGAEAVSPHHLLVVRRRHVGQRRDASGLAMLPGAGSRILSLPPRT